MKRRDERRAPELIEAVRDGWVSEDAAKLLARKRAPDAQRQILGALERDPTRRRDNGRKIRLRLGDSHDLPAPPPEIPPGALVDTVNAIDCIPEHRRKLRIKAAALSKIVREMIADVKEYRADLAASDLAGAADETEGAERLMVSISRTFVGAEPVDDEAARLAEIYRRLALAAEIEGLADLPRAHMDGVTFLDMLYSTNRPAPVEDDGEVMEMPKLDLPSMADAVGISEDALKKRRFRRRRR